MDGLKGYIESLPEVKYLSSSEEKEFNVNELVENSLKYVIKIAHSYKRKAPYMCLSELVAAGNQGLMEATKKFDTSKNCKFYTYASYYCRLYMRKAIENYNSVVKKGITINVDSLSTDDNGVGVDNGENIYANAITENKVEPDIYFDDNETYARLKILMSSKLTPIEQIIIQHRYINDKKTNYLDLCPLTGVSIEYVRILEQKALVKLRRHLKHYV